MNDKVVKRARKSKQLELKGSGLLLGALKFVSEAQSEEGSVYQTHCILHENVLSAFNGVLTIGVKVPESITCCPHTMKFIAALKHCGENLSISQLDSGKLSVKSGAFKALINCAAPVDMPMSYPDPLIAPATDALKAALAACVPLVKEGAIRAHASAVLLRAFSAVATDGFCLLEAWHGIDMPPGLLLPKVSAAVIAKCEKKVVGFGFSDASLTIWFDDESFIKTQLFKDQYPNVDVIFNQATEQDVIWLDVPENFYTGIDALESFSDNYVVFKENKLASAIDDAEACVYAIDGLPCGFALNIQFLKAAKPGMVKIADIGTNVHFAGNSIRGAIAKRRI